MKKYQKKCYLSSKKKTLSLDNISNLIPVSFFQAIKPNLFFKIKHKKNDVTFFASQESIKN